MARLVMHVDMDAFFAAIEQRDDPDLRGKPVIIGAQPGGRGVVSTASYEARVFGVHSAMPVSEAHRLCPDGIFLRPDFHRYKEASEGLMDVLRSISPVVEPVGIDEAYVDIAGLGRLLGSPAKIGHETKRRVHETLRLTASVGIGPNRVIAKIASDRLKPDGLTIVSPDDVVSFLAPLPVGDMRGVGRKTVPVLNRMGIRTIGDLQQRSLEDLQGFLGANQARALHIQAQGIASDFVGNVQARKSISKETTFQVDEKDFNVIRETLLTLACQVGRTSRRTGLAGQKVTIKARLPGFVTYTRQRKLLEPTQADLEIFHTGLELLRGAPFAKGPFRLIGIGIGDLLPEAAAKPNLMASDAERKAKRLYDVMDTIRDRHGEVISLGKPRKRRH